MILVCLHWKILLAFAFSIHQLNSQSPPGFISLDCGLSETTRMELLSGLTGYNDSTTGLYYSSDRYHVESSEEKSIAPRFITNSLPRQFLSVRSFPGSKGTRSCYTLKPLHNGDGMILLRVSFMYGNYDNLDQTPAFDLYLGVNYWERVEFKDASSVFTAEILHALTSDYLHVCLVNTGHGTPFISVIELRPIEPFHDKGPVVVPYDLSNPAGPKAATFSTSNAKSKPFYNMTLGSVELLARWDLGSMSANSVRYEDDMHDRIWKPINQANSTILRSNDTTGFQKQSFAIPPIVMSTAAQATTINDSLTMSFAPNDPLDETYIYAHFAELVPRQSRIMNLYINGQLWHERVVIPYLEEFTIYTSSAIVASPVYEITIKAAPNSTLPPMLNAIEIYTVKRFKYHETHEKEVAAIVDIKRNYSITRNWQGDPCLPQEFTWIGINCSYNGTESPRIISLNLSSSGLKGSIAPSIANLTMLQYLDLSYNNLIGEVPEFLAWLPFLRYLSLKGNNIDDSLPRGLSEKSKKGSLIIIRDCGIGSCDCGTGSCKKNKGKPVIAIVASVGSLIAVIAVSSLIYVFVTRKRQVVTESVTAQLHENNGSSIELKVRQYSYSEVLSFIQGREVLGRGGFGTVYRACLNGAEVAIKVLKVSLEQATKNFKSEVKILETVHHRNLTRILGYCNEGIHKAIVFELMENGNLSKYLSERSSTVLSWEQRLTILIGAAQGLEYLHHGCEPPIIHRDIKPENVLLTKDFEAKLADFGLSRFFPVQTSNVVGTLGYLDPKCWIPCMLTEKVDIYSFGVLMLVVVTGKCVVQSTTHITQWTHHRIERGDIRGIVDPRLAGNYDMNAAWRVVELAMACTSANSSSRPNMKYVVKELHNCLPSSI